MVKEFGVKFYPIYCGKLRRYFSFQNFLDFFKFLAGIFQSFMIIGKIKPDIVFSKGGFVSLPVVIGAFFRRVPSFIHESDLSPGLANRISFRMCKKAFLSFEESKKYLKNFKGEIIVSGSPVREEIVSGNSERALKSLKFGDKKPIIFVIGGSTGAKQINDLIFEAKDQLLKNFNIIHQCGSGKILEINDKGYRAFGFIKEEYFDFLALSDLVVSRAGANALFELAIAKKKALIIPMGSGRGDQLQNAKLFSKKIGWEVLSGNISVKDFVKSVKIASENKNLRFESFQNGTKIIADKLIENENSH